MIITYKFEENKNPCYECSERKVGCHCNCEKYKEWKNKYNDKKQQISSYINPNHCRYFKQKCVCDYNNKKSKKRYR